MYFFPEGQHDSKPGTKCLDHEENSPVPAGRLNGSRLRCIGGIADHVHLLLSSPTTVPIVKAILAFLKRHGLIFVNKYPWHRLDFGRPSGTGSLSEEPGHFVPGCAST